jgi:hypothetical protein
MSKNKRRTQALRARAAKALERNEGSVIESIDRGEKIKKLTPVSETKQPDTPPVTNPYLRMLRRIDAANAAREK